MLRLYHFAIYTPPPPPPPKKKKEKKKRKKGWFSVDQWLAGLASKSSHLCVGSTPTSDNALNLSQYDSGC